MYGTVLLLHSLLRWAVLLTGLLAAVRAIWGWRSRRPWTLPDERAGLWFTISLDLQFLLGLLLYVALSPITVARSRTSAARCRTGSPGSGLSSTSSE